MSYTWKHESHKWEHRRGHETQPRLPKGPGAEVGLEYTGWSLVLKGGWALRHGTEQSGTSL